MAVQLVESRLRPISLGRMGQIIRAVSGKAAAQFNNPGCDRGQYLQGGHWSWVGARVSERTSKTLGLGMVLVVVQILGQRTAHLSFLVETPLGSCRVKEAGCLYPIIWPDLKGRRQALPEGGK